MPSRLLLPEMAQAALASLLHGIASARAIRVVNFHATPRYRQDEFRAQIAAFATLFEPITIANLPAAIDGSWPHARPGLIPVLFEGFRDNLDVMLPILEENGFTGWFFVPSAFPKVPADEQRAFAAAHLLHLPARDEYPGQRVALNWDELRTISRRGHVVACHTRTHNELRTDTPTSVLEEEISLAKTEIQGELGQDVDVFCWLRGAELGVNLEADRLLRHAGFKYLFSNYKIQRLA